VSAFGGDGFSTPEMFAIRQEIKMHVEGMKTPSGDGRHSSSKAPQVNCKSSEDTEMPFWVLLGTTSRIIIESFRLERTFKVIESNC